MIKLLLQAHVYHYTQVRGFEETHFIDCKEIILNLITQYTKLQSQNEINVSRLQIL